MKNEKHLYILFRGLRDHSNSYQREIVDSYLRLAESGNWAQISQLFTNERKGR
ncbi:MAG: hypothetical protein IKX74_05890 [Erysipelotrichaceae bacterium]|nr:hypothetical protein [Erysipelotrichaceae bacterium]MBR5049151.1 hypothetical protein [Erysipelotrichaceae bacterium]